MEDADAETLGEAGLAGEAIVLARHDLEQGGLARSVAADHADLGSREHGDVDSPEDFAVGRIEPPQVAHGVDELSRHWGQDWHAPALPQAPALPTYARRYDQVRDE